MQPVHIQLDIATTSLAGSVNPSADEAEDEDEFNETINMVHGIRTEERKSSAKKTSTLQPERGMYNSLLSNCTALVYM